MSKSRAHRTTIENFKNWSSRGWIETDGSDGKLYVEPSPLERHQKTYYDLSQLKTKYDQYVLKQIENQNIEKKYKLHQKCFECTLNTWDEVDSLGITRHPETEWIWSQFDIADNVNQARHKFRLYNDCSYDEVRGRRNPSGDLWILKTTDIFPWKFTSQEIHVMMHATGNTLGEKIKGHRNRYQSIINHDWEILIERDLAFKTDHQGLNYYALNEFGLSIVRLMLPTSQRIYHFREIQYLRNNGFEINTEILSEL